MNIFVYIFKNKHQPTLMNTHLMYTPLNVSGCTVYKKMVFFYTISGCKSKNHV